MLIRLLIRGFQVFLLTLFYGVLFLFCRKKSKRRAVILRKYFQACGGVFVKLGQIMAMRYDLLPEHYCLELSSLLDKLHPFPFPAIRKIIENDLGQSLEQLYAFVNETPLGTASIAQVHAATLHSGDRVVIKVLRPNARRDFEVDLKILRMGCTLLSTIGFWEHISLSQLADDVTQMTREEMDFRKEARNIQNMHVRMKADDIAHYAPALCPEFCGKKVITMERIEGVPVSIMLNALDKKEHQQILQWEEEGISPKRTACILLRSFLEQSMHYRFFHADPHAANLIVMKGGTLAWIDFGMMGQLDEKLWLAQYNMRRSLAQQNITQAYNYFIQTLGVLPNRDLSAFESEIKNHFRDWISVSDMPGATIAEKSSGYFFLRIFAAVRKEKIPMPINMVRLYRAILISDIVMLRLYPEVDWISLMRDFVKEKETKHLVELAGEFFQPSYYKRIIEGLIVYPDAAYNLAQWLQEGLPQLRRDVNLQLSRMERIWRALFRMCRNISGLAVLYVFFHRLFNMYALYKNDWQPAGNWLYDHWLAMAVGCSISFLFWGRLARAFKE